MNLDPFDPESTLASPSENTPVALALLRDHFATIALPSLIARSPHYLHGNIRQIAHDAYEYADAMLEMRARPPEPR